MFGISWHDLSKEVRGVLLIIFGSILLLHTLNILQKWLTWILIFISLAMIIYGIIQSGLWDKTYKMVQKKE